MADSNVADFPRDLRAPMAAAYDPHAVEAGWSTWWEEKGFFTPDQKDGAAASEQDKFVMVIPPPNVTGSLHIGHALTVAIEDAVVRWHRMCGRVTLWVPGVDHAGIATQSVVERQMHKAEGLTRHDVGRTEFLKRVWQWKEKNENRIKFQLRRVGASVDWSREAFTLDDNLTAAVKEAFVKMYEAGLIYRATRLVSWCPFLKTALSDIEVDVEEIDGPTRIKVPGYDRTIETGSLWHFKYQLADDPNLSIEVATTRLETMLGDVAVAVHPDDHRYMHLVGRCLVHPFCNDREMKIIADEYVDPDFGTGAVKITPAHDKNDYEIGLRHGLEQLTIFTLEGRIAEGCGQFSGQHRFECRAKIERELDLLGLLGEKTKNPNKMQLPRCSRSNDVIEYMLIPQWWVKCDDMALRALEAARSGELQLIPSWHITSWEHWLSNIKDWCISRQLWWGHRIPAYRVVHDDDDERETWVVARNEEEAILKAEELTGCSRPSVIQDEDVLDTWFSSGLFPFSVMGWPRETQDLDAFFPTTLLETGWDILFFWVARMVMMSIQLTGKLPFREVHLHAMVRDAHGKKMSKTLGNVIDPIEVIEGITLQRMQDALMHGNLPEKEVKRAIDAQKKDFPNGIPQCGADALRYGLLAYTKQGKSINLDIGVVHGYRFFCNKLWNAVKFALSKFPPDFTAKGIREEWELNWADRWILKCLSDASAATNTAFEKQQFSDGVTSTYRFWLYELCDVYLELTKRRLTEDDDDDDDDDRNIVYEVLYRCFDQGLRLLHPFVPFISEELYQRLPPSEWKAESIAIATYPTPTADTGTDELQDEFQLFQSIIRHFRNLQALLRVPPKTKLAGFVMCESNTKFVEERLPEIASLAKLESCTAVCTPPSGSFVGDVVNDTTRVWVDRGCLGDITSLLGLLEKKTGDVERALAGYVAKIEKPGYEKVPDDVKRLNEEKIAALREEKRALDGILASLRNPA